MTKQSGGKGEGRTWVENVPRSAMSERIRAGFYVGEAVDSTVSMEALRMADLVGIYLDHADVCVWNDEAQRIVVSREYAEACKLVQKSGRSSRDDRHYTDSDGQKVEVGEVV